MLKSGIYKITNLINNKCYIGQSKNIKRRFTAHKSYARLHRDSYPIHLAISKHGVDNFKFEVLEYAPLTKLDELEIKYINQFDSINSGYNIREGGNGKINANSIIYKNLSDIISDIKSNKLYFKDIAKKYNVTPALITYINQGKVWEQGSLEYPIRHTKEKKYHAAVCLNCGKRLSLTKERSKSKLCQSCYNSKRSGNITKKKLLKDIANGLYIQQIANKYSVTHTTVIRWIKKFNI